MVARLKSLQDGLGDAHDALVFLPDLDEALSEVQDERPAELGPGLRALADALRLRGSRAFERVAGEWLGRDRQRFFDALRSASLRLEEHSTHGREVERKYLLEGLPDALLESPWIEIEQGYLPAVAVDPAVLTEGTLTADVVNAWEAIASNNKVGHYLDWTIPYDEIVAALQELLGGQITPEEFVANVEAVYVESGE